MVTRSAIQLSLGRKLADNGDWETATAEPGEKLDLQIQTEPGRFEDARKVVGDAAGDILSEYDSGEGALSLIRAELRADKVSEIARSDAIRLVGEWKPAVLHGETKLGTTDDDIPVTPRFGRAEVDDVDASVLESDSVESLGDHLITTEGVEITNADALHDMGVTGEGATIAILDSGFDIHNPQYEDQWIATLGLEPGDPGFSDAYENPGGHGDAVAEIVASMAPDADLVLADTFDATDLFSALDTIDEEYPEVDIANYSVGHLPDFPIDGTDPISLRIDEWTDEHRIFVNSAGNSGAVYNAWAWVDGFGPVPVPQNNGDAYDSQGTGQFVENDGKELLEFDAHFDEDLEVSTRLPAMTFEDVSVFAAFGVDLGWTVVHWDADVEVDDQEYAVRLYRTPHAEEPVEDPASGEPIVSNTTNPWETITVWAEWFEGETQITMDVVDDAWVITDVDGEPFVAPTGEDNPLMVLPEGQRYTIVNEAWEDHPLELRDENGNPLLSQDPDTDGAFEDDSIVNWVAEDEQVSFTLTDGDAYLAGADGLSSLLDGYVSATDPDTVAGDAASDIAEPIYVEIERVDADEDHHFDVWGQFGGVNIPTPWATDARTVGIPAVSRDDDLWSVAAVQAVDLGPDEGETGLAFNQNAGDLKAYSSQGPTQDGRLGIDVAAPSHVSTEARGPVEDVFGFNGTSAAAPHVAGAAGLLSASSFDPTTDTIRAAVQTAGGGIPDPEVDDPENTAIGKGFLDVYEAYQNLEVTGIDVLGSVDIPEVTARVEDEWMTIDQVGRLDPGDGLTVTTSAPEYLSYAIEFRNSDMQLIGVRNVSGDAQATFDTEGLDPGTYAVAAVVDGDDIHAAVPVVLSGYRAKITNAPATVEEGEDLYVKAELEPVGSPPGVRGVGLGLLSEEDNTAGTFEMEKIDDYEYEVTISNAPGGDHELSVVVVGDEVIEEISVPGFIDDFLDVGDEGEVNEPIGFSDPVEVSVDVDVLSEKWLVHTGRAVQFARPDVGDGLVFTGGLSDETAGLYRENGKVRWKFEREGSLSDSSPVLYDGTVYIGSGGGKLYALTADTDDPDGHVEWEYDAGSAITSTPAVHDGTVYVASNDGTVYGFDAENGDKLIESDEFDDFIISDIEVGEVSGSGTVLFVTTKGGTLGIIDADDGTRLGKFSTGDTFGSSGPVYDEEAETLYVAGDVLHAVDVQETLTQETLETDWQQEDYSGPAGSNPVLYDGGLYVSGADGKLYAVSTSSGDISWTFDPDNEIAAAPAVIGGRVIVGALDGTLYVLDRFFGDEIDIRAVDEPIRTQPTVEGDSVYVGTEAGSIFAFENIP